MPNLTFQKLRRKVQGKLLATQPSVVEPGLLGSHCSACLHHLLVVSLSGL
jgi:hypothetical protein